MYGWHVIDINVALLNTFLVRYLKKLFEAPELIEVCLPLTISWTVKQKLLWKCIDASKNIHTLERNHVFGKFVDLHFHSRESQLKIIDMKSVVEFCNSYSETFNICSIFGIFFMLLLRHAFRTLIETLCWTAVSPASDFDGCWTYFKEW